MKNLLIVGGTGFIGYHLLKEAQKNSNRWIIKWLEFEIEETKNKLNE